jgi:dihydroorotate dehydrogenase
MTLYPLIRPLLFALDPERAHRLAVLALKLRSDDRRPSLDPALAIEVAGVRFPSPIGLAAGFDKDGEVADALLNLGFGFVEVGTITPAPQPGNPKPRMFRLTEDQAVINRLGFNSRGQALARERLEQRGDRPGIVGINIGANKDSPSRIADYVTGVRNMAKLATYLTVNISSPNTPGLRALQSGDALDELLASVRAARGKGRPPIFLKVAPDLEPAEIDAIARTAIDRRVDALIVSNTTVSRPPLSSRHAGEAGGLSGAPLRDLALQRLRDFRAATGGQLPLIGVGGIASADDAYARIRAGASLVQLYTAMIYRGPGLPRRISIELADLLARDGFASVGEAVGIDG